MSDFNFRPLLNICLFVQSNFTRAPRYSVSPTEDSVKILTGNTTGALIFNFCQYAVTMRKCHDIVAHVVSNYHKKWWKWQKVCVTPLWT